MSFGRGNEVKLGGSLAVFFGGHVASARLTASESDGWSAASEASPSNGEALRRVCIALLCWLDGHDLLVTPALRGDVVMRPERKRDFGSDP